MIVCNKKKNTLNIVHVVNDLDIASGGPSRSVPALVYSQSKISGVNVFLLYRERGRPVIQAPKGRVTYCVVKVGLSSKAFLNFLPRDLLHSKNTIFHLHGLWSPLIHFAAIFANNHNIPYIISTRGMLAPWCLAHKSLKKRLGWWFYQKRDMNRAACIIATGEPEKRDVLDIIPAQKVEVIPNGCSEPTILTVASNNNVFPREFNARWCLAIGRLHPVKGYEELLNAWSTLRPKGWALAIVGPDEAGYRKKLEKIIDNLKLSKCIVLLGEVEGCRKWKLLEQCELFIAPSRTENFGMAIAEALQSGTPVITTTGTPWCEIRDHHCGWWVKPDIVGIENALEEATSVNSKNLRRMGENGRRLIAENYLWSKIAKKTLGLYSSVFSTCRYF